MAFNVSCDADGFELAVYGRYAEQQIVNVFGVHVDRLAAAANWVGGSTFMLAAFRLWFRARPLGGLANGYRVESYILRKVDQTIPRPFPLKWRFSVVDALAGEAADVGSGGAAALSTQATSNHTLRTGIVGRSFKGRKSYSPVPEDSTKDSVGGGNELTDTAMAAYASDWAAFLAGLEMVDGADTRLLILTVNSLKRYGQGLDSAFWSTKVTSVKVQRHTGSQISRKQKNAGA